MSFTAQELKKLILPLLACLGLLAAGAALITWVRQEQREAARELTAAREAQAQARERLMRIAEEEREVKEKLQVYLRLRELHILGDDRRLEWADAMTRIRTQRELPDLRYRVERQRLLSSVGPKATSVDFFASAMKLEVAALHEGDLLNFLTDLRESGNAYYAVRRCSLARTGPALAVAGLAPRLRAECEIDLITIIDRAAKT
jgi:hypothetical protein